MSLRIATNKESKKFLLDDVETILFWECQCCSGKFESEPGETKNDFINRLIKEDEIKYVYMDEMQGLFCPDCYNDKEIQQLSL